MISCNLILRVHLNTFKMFSLWGCFCNESEKHRWKTWCITAVSMLMLKPKSQSSKDSYTERNPKHVTHSHTKTPMKHAIINSDLFRCQVIFSLAEMCISLTVSVNLPRLETFSSSCTVWFWVMTELSFGLYSMLFLFCWPKEKDAIFWHRYKSRQQKGLTVPIHEIWKSILLKEPTC